MSTQADEEKLRSLDDIYKALREFFITNFPTPAHLLAWIDNDLNEGKYSLHKWQASLHSEHFSIEKTKQFTATSPLELCIKAVNGSGKDEKVITPFVLHFLATNQESSVVLTSASGQQLKTQTEKYLRRYCTILNAKLSALFNLEETYEFFIIQQRYFKCVFTSAECILFATDEEGKAEGYHPTISGAKFAIIVNEGKSIAEPIWEALSRCNGFTHWIEVSSPGRPDGHFFRTCTSTRTTSSGANAVIKVVVVSDDCPHLGGEDYIKRLVEIYGSRDHYMVKSMVDADFSSADEQVVITYDIYNRLLAYQINTEHIADTKNCGGLDLAFGGDEIRLQVRNGNKHLGGESLISKDTSVICNTINRWIIKWNLQTSVVYTDAGGLGAPIVSLLRGQYGLKCITPINNQWSAKNGIAYKNLGVEIKDEENLWYMVENKNEDSLKVMEKLIAKRRAELKKGGSKSNAAKEISNY